MSRIEIKMPDLSTTGDEVLLLRWLIPVGEPVKLGQPLYEVETDKTTMEVESVAAGVLESVRAEAGKPVPVGQVIAVISSAARADAPSVPLHVVTPIPSVVPVSISVPIQPPLTQRQSMFSRNRAARQSVTSPVPMSAAIALTPAQRTAARRLQQAKQTVPHFYLTLSANAEAMVKAREALGGVVWDAFFVRAVARAATAFGRMRLRFEDDQLLPIEGDAVGVAVDVNDDLYVVGVEKPQAKSVQDISQRIIQQVESLHQGDPSARRLSPCWMTISNLGGAGIEAFAPIINPPQSAILGIGQIARVPHVQDGGLVIQQRVTLTLAVDHRVASGKYAAAFLKRIIEELEATS